MRFGDNLRNIRIQRGLSQMQLAKDLQTSQSAITAYEVGKREPSFQVIERIANYFGVPMSALLPSNDFVEEDLIAVITESVHQNPNLKELFFLAKDFSPENINVLLSVAKSISGKTQA